jgi:hypothetical protein
MVKDSHPQLLLEQSEPSYKAPLLAKSLKQQLLIL